MSTPPNSTARRSLVEALVHTWRGRLSPQTQRALSTYDVDALEAMVSGAIEVIIARRGTIPGATPAMEDGFASIRQDLHLNVLAGLLDAAALIEALDGPTAYSVEPDNGETSAQLRRLAEGL